MDIQLTCAKLNTFPKNLTNFYHMGTGALIPRVGRWTWSRVS